MKKYIYLIIGFMIFASSHFSNSHENNFLLKKNPYYPNNNIFIDGKTNEVKITDLAIDLTKYLPEDYLKDASKDYTKYIQKGLNENKIVKMPNFPLLVNKNGLIIKSGSRIYFQKDSSLVMQPNSLEIYGVMILSNIEDVIIYSPVVFGERAYHLGLKGEWGMGIYILGSKDVQIIKPMVYDCWGDGIYIGKGKNGSCENVKIADAVINNSRRNGISLTDGKDVEILNPIISNTNGTLPMCGIDIEPNENNAIIENIHILNPITFNNSHAGILIHLGGFIGPVKKKVGIKIENHLDDGSDTGFILSGCKEQNNTNLPLSGAIDIINPQWKNNRRSIDSGNNSMGPKINFKNINIENPKEDLQKIKQELSNNKNVNVE